jgi:predicted transcriptional regulator
MPLERGASMENEARIVRLLAVFNGLPDKDKEAVLALMEKLGRKEAVLACNAQADNGNDQDHNFKESIV